MWENIVRLMQDDGLVKNSLPLRCEVHPDQTTLASTADDFKKAPEGGCEKKCGWLLGCGHKCTRACHITDRKHLTFRCLETCSKPCPEGHPCKKKCYMACGDCAHLVKKVVPNCKHEQMIPCSQPADVFSCRAPCEFILDCMHKCTNFCGEKHVSRCMEKVLKIFPCGHCNHIPCWETEDAKCESKCNKQLDCGHYCQAKCGDCKGLEEHQPCSHPCNLMLSCGHRCNNLCSQPHTVTCQVEVRTSFPCGHKEVEPCCNSHTTCAQMCKTKLLCGHECLASCLDCRGGRLHKPCNHPIKEHQKCSHSLKAICSSSKTPCMQPCTVDHPHSKCSLPCGAPCTPCMEPCTWECKHIKCGKKCSEPCDRPRCDIRCDKKLTCSHPCSGLCSEPCPPLCLHCNLENSDGYVAGDILMVLSCGHIFRVTELDQKVCSKGLLLCPSCYQRITCPDRYTDLLRDFSIKDQAERQQQWGSFQEIETIRQQISAGFKTLSDSSFQEVFQSELHKEFPTITFKAMLIQLEVYQKVKETMNMITQYERFASEEARKLKSSGAALSQWCLTRRDVISAQEQSDFEIELLRLSVGAMLLKKMGTAIDLSSKEQELIEISIQERPLATKDINVLKKYLYPTAEMGKKHGKRNSSKAGKKSTDKGASATASDGSSKSVGPNNTAIKTAQGEQGNDIDNMNQSTTDQSYGEEVNYIVKIDPTTVLPQADPSVTPRSIEDSSSRFTYVASDMSGPVASIDVASDMTDPAASTASDMTHPAGSTASDMTDPAGSTASDMTDQAASTASDMTAGSTGVTSHPTDSSSRAVNDDVAQYVKSDTEAPIEDGSPAEENDLPIVDSFQNIKLS